MNVNCNGNSDLKSVRLKPILPDYLKKENVKENLEAAEEADVQRAIKPEPKDLSITVNANDILALYNIGAVSAVRGNNKPEAAQVVIVPRDDIFHDDGYDELVHRWENSDEHLNDKDKIKLLSLIIDRVGNDETAKNMWCAIRFEITNNVYMTNINNIDGNDGFGYNSLMNILQMLDVTKGDDQICAKKCIDEGNSKEQQLIGYNALLAEQNAVIEVCRKLLESPHLRRKDYPMIQSRLSGAMEKADFYTSKIKELNGIIVHSDNIAEAQNIQNSVD